MRNLSGLIFYFVNAFRRPILRITLVVATIGAMLMPAGWWVRESQGSGYALASSASADVRSWVQDAQSDALARAPQTRQEFLRYLGEALSELGATNGAWFGLEEWPLDDALYWVVEGQDGWSTIPIVPPNVRVWVSGLLAHTISFSSNGILAEEIEHGHYLPVLARATHSVVRIALATWRFIPPARAP